MTRFIGMTAAIIMVFMAACPMMADVSPWATSFSTETPDKIGPSPYDDLLSMFGKPSILAVEPLIVPPKTFHCSMVYPACQTDPSGGKLLTMILSGGSVVAYFDPPIYDDARHWYNRDFIIFGNSAFTKVGSAYLDQGNEMESVQIKNGTEGTWEPMTVSVAQSADGPWYTYSSGPYADDYAPLQPSAWDWVNHAWGPEMDFTRPVDPDIAQSSFGGRYVPDAIDLYKGSGGGTSFRLADLLDLPVDTSGRKWIRYVKVTADRLDGGSVCEGEIDTFARVSDRIDPMSIGEAKRLPDGAHAVLKPAVVTAGTYELGPYCYVEDTDRCAGIKILGRVLARGNTVTLYGDLDTVDGERVIRATGLESGEDALVTPLGMPVRGVESSQGLSTLGLLVRTCGKIKSLDRTAKTFTIDDGSGRALRCVAPTSDAMLPLAQSLYVKVNGISSCEMIGQQSSPVLRVRDGADIEGVYVK